MTEKGHLTAEEWSRRFSSEPFNVTPSYEPYAIADHPDAAEKRVTLLRDFFDSEDGQWPDLGETYPNLAKTADVRPEWVLQKLLLDTGKIADPAEADLLYEQAALKLAELYRHRQVIRMLGHSGLKQDHARREAGRMSLEIFGLPEKEAFASAVDAVRQKASRYVDTSVIAQELLDLLGPVRPEHATSSFELSDETIYTLRTDLFEIFPGLEEVMVADDAFKSVTAKESLPYFQRMIDFLGMDGWTAVLKAGKGAETSAKLEEIRVGVDSIPFSPQILNGLMGHEVIGHGYRSFNASRQTRAVLHNLLPGALEFEEGWGMGLQQIISGKKVSAGLTHYTSLGLQLGLDRNDQVPRGFRDIYEILWRRGVVDELAKGVTTTEEVITRAKAAAQRNALRATRGGALDARDISYFEGARKANELLNETAKLPKEERLARIKWVSSARFDPTNESHVSVVDKIT